MDFRNGLVPVQKRRFSAILASTCGFSCAAYHGGGLQGHRTRFPGRPPRHPHGFFLDNAPPAASAGGRGVGGLVAAEAAPDPDDTPSRHLSGLVFAGANRSEAAVPEDGILTAEEIATLDLDGVEWVVLSACESGVGEVASHEGVLGLQHAFRFAGVRTVVMSLWGINNEAAREWMTSFYHARLVDGLATADAVRRADLGVLNARRERGASVHPAYWAAFQATGDRR